MNRDRSKFMYTILLSFSTFFFVWIGSASNIVLSQTSLIPAPSLQNEQTELLTSEPNTLPPEVQSAVINDAVKQTSKTVAALEITEAQPQEWSDGCLGLGKSDELCTQAITPGWQVVVTDGVRTWTYRTDDSGDTVRLEEFVGGGE